jgi:hypothetical protein
MSTGEDAAVVVWTGVCVSVSVTGQMVVYTAMVSVVTWPTGQLVTVGGQLVTVCTEVVNMVLVTRLGPVVVGPAAALVAVLVTAGSLVPVGGSLGDEVAVVVVEITSTGPVVGSAGPVSVVFNFSPPAPTLVAAAVVVVEVEVEVEVDVELELELVVVVE